MGAPGAEIVDPRVERSRRVICEAALDELAEVGYGAMTVESIARRAGVGKATVYRHWRGKLDLLESALDLMREEVIVPQAGSVRERVVSLLSWLARYLADSPMSNCLPSIVSAAHHDVSVREFHHRFIGERRQILVDLLDEGVAAGEITPGGGAAIDTELLAEALMGPLFFRRLMTPAAFPSERADDIVQLVLGPE